MFKEIQPQNYYLYCKIRCMDNVAAKNLDQHSYDKGV